MAMTLPLAATLVLAACALVGAWLDISQRRIPNWLCLVTMVAGLAFAVMTGGAGALLSPLAHAAIALVVGMILFRIGWIGGGDAKFYAACAAWFPLGLGPRLIGMVSLAGLVVILGWFAYRQMSGKRRRASSGDFAMVPYGVAVAVGSVGLALWP
jgi:prepilin peptidase CpaA